MLLRETVEVVGVFALALPSVAEIIVVAENRDHPSIIVIVGPEVRCDIAGRRTMPVFVLIPVPPCLNVNNLR